MSVKKRPQVSASRKRNSVQTRNAKAGNTQSRKSAKSSTAQSRSRASESKRAVTRGKKQQAHARSTTRTQNEASERFSANLQGTAKEGVAIVMLAICAFLLLSFVSYSSSDPGWSSSGPEQGVYNWMGEAGAWISNVLLALFGYAAIWFPVLFGLSGWHLFRIEFAKIEWRPARLAIRFIGLACVLVSSTALISLAMASPDSSLPNNAGGIIGQAVTHNINGMVGAYGLTLIAFVLMLCGVPMLTNRSWSVVLGNIGAAATYLAKGIASQISRLKERRSDRYRFDEASEPSSHHEESEPETVEAAHSSDDILFEEREQGKRPGLLSRMGNLLKRHSRRAPMLPYGEEHSEGLDERRHDHSERRDFRDRLPAYSEAYQSNGYDLAESSNSNKADIPWDDVDSMPSRRTRRDYWQPTEEAERPVSAASEPRESSSFTGEARPIRDRHNEWPIRNPSFRHEEEREEYQDTEPKSESSARRDSWPKHHAAYFSSRPAITVDSLQEPTYTSEAHETHSNRTETPDGARTAYGARFMDIHASRNAHEESSSASSSASHEAEPKRGMQAPGVSGVASVATWGASASTLANEVSKQGVGQTSPAPESTPSSTRHDAPTSGLSGGQHPVKEKDGLLAPSSYVPDFEHQLSGGSSEAQQSQSAPATEQQPVRDDSSDVTRRRIPEQFAARETSSEENRNTTAESLETDTSDKSSHAVTKPRIRMGAGNSYPESSDSSSSEGDSHSEAHAATPSSETAADQFENRLGSESEPASSQPLNTSTDEPKIWEERESHSANTAHGVAPSSVQSTPADSGGEQTASHDETVESKHADTQGEHAGSADDHRGLFGEDTDTNDDEMSSVQPTAPMTQPSSSAQQHSATPTQAPSSMPSGVSGNEIVASHHQAAPVNPNAPRVWTVEQLQNQGGSNNMAAPEGEMPSTDLLTPADELQPSYSQQQLDDMAELLETRLREYGVKAEVVDVSPGPVITRFEIELAAGVKSSKISNLDKDLARSLLVKSVRVIEVIQGRSTVGIEIPNPKRAMIRLRQVLETPVYEEAESPVTVALGQSISGQPMVADLGKMPHVLVAGTTGSGKSVGVNAMLISMLLKSTPEEVRMILIDPKMLELSVYDDIPHLLAPVVTDMKEAANSLRWCVAEMERRYKLMSKMGVRNIAGFNARLDEAHAAGAQIADPLWDPEPWQISEPQPMLEKLPYIVVVIDEFADMFMIVGKKVEELIARLAQKARAAGIHLVLATQRPSVDVVTGLIKANIPSRIAFQVSSKIDSRTILDQGGAESLLGHGDMLYLSGGAGSPVRVHGAFVDDAEVHRVVENWKMRGKPEYVEEILSGAVSADALTGLEGDSDNNSDAEQDVLYDEAVAFVTKAQRVSVSSVQRNFKIGYNRASRLVEAMEKAGVVSSMGTNGAREVLVSAPPRD